MIIKSVKVEVANITKTDGTLLQATFNNHGNMLSSETFINKSFMMQKNWKLTKTTLLNSYVLYMKRWGAIPTKYRRVETAKSCHKKRRIYFLKFNCPWFFH